MRWLALLCLISSARAGAVCYDPNTPDHHCDIPAGLPPESSDWPVIAIQTAIAIDSGRVVDALSAVLKDPKTITVKGEGQAQVIGLYRDATSVPERIQRRKTILSGLKPLGTEEVMAIVTTGPAISALGTERAAALSLPASGHVDRVVTSLSKKANASSEITFGLQPGPCPLDGTIDLVEKLSVNANGWIMSTVQSKTGSYTPGWLFCAVIEPGLVTMTISVAQAIISGLDTPVMAALVKELPVCIADGQKSFFIRYDRAEVVGHFLYMAASLGQAGPPPPGRKAPACGLDAACACKCPDITSDPANCGGCGKACARGQKCSNSHCECPNGLSLCSNECVNTQASLANCGKCGHGCAGEQKCHRGKCVLPTSSPCLSDEYHCVCPGFDFCAKDKPECTGICSH
jgi:hypothetical protein